MSAASQVRRATGEVRAQIFCWTTRLEVTVVIRKSNHAIGIRYIQKLRIVTRWIKRDAERFVQTLFCKNFGERPPKAFGVALCGAQHFDLISATLHHKDIAIRRGQQKSRITK